MRKFKKGIDMKMHDKVQKTIKTDKKGHIINKQEVREKNVKCFSNQVLLWDIITAHTSEDRLVCTNELISRLCDRKELLNGVDWKKYGYDKPIDLSYQEDKCQDRRKR